MSAPPTFPTLPGQGWNVHKKPVFSTRVASHVSGREVRAGLYAHALYEFELTFDALDSSGVFPGLQAQSLQMLMGFFLTAQGQLNSFLYLDPTDNTVTNQGVATGDGSTTTFTLGRAIGGFYEPISYAPTASALTEINYGAEGGGLNYLPNNLIPNSAVAGLGFGIHDLTASNGQTDPNGGTLATLYSEQAVSGFASGGLSVGGVPAGSLIVYSIYLKANGSTQYWEIWSDNGANVGYVANFDLVNGVATGTKSANGGGSPQLVTITPAGNGWFRCSVCGVVSPIATTVRFNICGAANSATPAWLPVYTGNPANGVYAAFPQAEVVTAAAAPRAFMPTSGAAYYGSPLVTVNGVLATNATFTAPNIITFASAPALGAVIAWSGTYTFQCRFLDDQWDFENFMSGLWQNKSVKFRSIR